MAAQGQWTTIDPAQFCRAWRGRQRRRRLRTAIAPAALMLTASLAVAYAWPIYAGHPATAIEPPHANLASARPLDPSAHAAAEPPGTQRILYLAPKQTLDGLLIDAGIARADAGRAARLVDSAIFPDGIPAGTAVTLATRPGGHDGAATMERVTLRPRIDLATTVRRAADGLVLDARPIAIDASPLELRGAVGADLTRSLIAARTPPRMLATVRAALTAHAGGRLQPSDRFELVFEQHRASDGEVAIGDLLYAAAKRDGRPLVELMRWRRDDGLNPVAAQPGVGASPSPGPLPIAGHLTSGYGMRFHPILGYTRLHAGVDVAAPWGAPVVAARDGVVRLAGWQGGHGNYIRLAHGAGIDTGYAHLSRLAVTAGQRVSAGEVVGYVGSTGLSTGPHLHYEVFREGRPVDPLRADVFAATTGQPPSRAFVAALASLRALVRAP